MRFCPSRRQTICHRDLPRSISKTFCVLNSRYLFEVCYSFFNLKRKRKGDCSLSPAQTQDLPPRPQGAPPTPPSPPSPPNPPLTPHPTPIPPPPHPPIPIPFPPPVHPLSPSPPPPGPPSLHPPFHTPLPSRKNPPPPSALSESRYERGSASENPADSTPPRRRARDSEWTRKVSRSPALPETRPASPRRRGRPPRSRLSESF